MREQTLEERLSILLWSMFGDMNEDASLYEGRALSIIDSLQENYVIKTIEEALMGPCGCPACT